MNPGAEANFGVYHEPGKAMGIHLVAIDLDGTLLNSSKEITETTAAILRDARRMRDVHIVLASARPPRTVMPFYNLLDLDTPMINYNGALVYDPPSRRVLVHRPIPMRTARRIVALAQEVYPQVIVSAEVMDRWFTNKISEEYLTATALTYRPDVIGPVQQWLTEPVTKLLLLGSAGKLVKVAKAVQKELLHQVTIVQTEGYLLQIMYPTVSKAQGLRVVAGELGVNREEVMAIGDNANDVSMLRWAGIGVAMANAAPSALAAADYVTDHHDADGAAKAIRRIILQGLPPRDRM